MKVWELIAVLSRLDPAQEIVLQPLGERRFAPTRRFEFENPFCESQPRLVFDLEEFHIDPDSCEQCDELKSRCQRLQDAIELLFRGDVTGGTVDLRKLDALREALEP